MNHTQKMEQKADKAKEVRIKLGEVLSKFAEENGLESLSIGNISYDEEGFSTRLSAKFELDSKEEEVYFNRKAILMGLRGGLYKEELDIKGKKFTIVEINTNAPVNSIIAEDEGGTRYSLRSSSFKK